MPQGWMKGIHLAAGNGTHSAAMEHDGALYSSWTVIGQGGPQMATVPVSSLRPD